MLVLAICVIALGIIFIDARLARIRRIELEILKEIQTSNDRQNETNKALQWMIDHWKGQP